jgi:hypothetical protein
MVLAILLLAGEQSQALCENTTPLGLGRTMNDEVTRLSWYLLPDINPALA